MIRIGIGLEKTFLLSKPVSILLKKRELTKISDLWRLNGSSSFSRKISKINFVNLKEIFMIWIIFFQCGSRLNVFVVKNVFYRGQIPSLINVMTLRKPDTVVRYYWHFPVPLLFKAASKRKTSIRILNVC